MAQSKPVLGEEFHRLVYRKCPSMIINRTYTEHLGPGLWLGRGFLNGVHVAFIGYLDTKSVVIIPVENIAKIASIVADWQAH